MITGELAEECGYQFNQAPVKLLTTGYADDLGLGTGSSKGQSAIQNNQRVVDALNVWLDWSQMKEKPQKCVTMALEQGNPVDPELTIQVGDKSFPMAYIGDEEYDRKARGPWFKFLGRFLVALLNETHAKEVLLKRVVEAGERIQGAALRGTQKVWI